MSRNEDAVFHLNMARQAENQGDYLAARMGYLKCVESWKQFGDIGELQKASAEYEEFVRRDPIFNKLLPIFCSIIQQNPKILQSDITKQAESIDWSGLYSYNRPVAKEDIYYVLYFAEKLGKISRVKKGRSYELCIVN